jgi:hypothetical protein
VIRTCYCDRGLIFSELKAVTLSRLGLVSPAAGIFRLIFHKRKQYLIRLGKTVKFPPPPLRTEIIHFPWLYNLGCRYQEIHTHSGVTI